MFIAIYLFALVFGGVLLGASILFGGKDLHGGDVGSDFDVGPDVDVDGELDVDGDGHFDDIHAQPGGLHVGGLDLGFFLWTFRSVRFWTFFLAFFGLTGLVVDGFGLVGSSVIGLAIALAMGVASGFGAAGVIRWLSSDEAGQTARSGDYIGQSARVLVPVRKDGLGKIRVRIKGQEVDVLATTDEADEFARSEEALIIEMDGAHARIARLGKKSGAD